MFAVKILERKSVIQFFGAALLLAPLVNISLSIWLRSPGIGGWSLQSYWNVLNITTNLPARFLYILSMLIGVVMLRGSPSTWKFVLFLLGSYILIQLPHLKNDIKVNKLMGLIFLINVFVFYFVADQLVWKIKKAKHASGAYARKKILIHFENFGPWAELRAISKNGIHVHSLRPPPEDLGERRIEVSLKNGLILQTRFSKKDHEDFFFEFQSLTPAEIKSLNQWLHQQAA